jgi:hypothetical protein
VKYTSALPWLGQSDVILEKAGWSQSDIQRAMVGKRKQDLLTLAGAAPVAPQATPASAPEAAGIQTQVPVAQPA